ncbi:hypothetical protein BH11ACT3_BH11ACT3_02760 [soil metagenome]
MTDLVALPLARVEDANRDFIRALGELVIVSSRLDYVFSALSTTMKVDGAARRSTVGRHKSSDSDPAARWTQSARDLLDIRARLFSSIATTRFSGSTGEAVLIVGDDGSVVPADVDFLRSVCRRMARLETIGLSLRWALEDSSSEGAE